MTGMRWLRTRATHAGRNMARWAGRSLLPGARRCGLGRNGLRRRSDRGESAGLVVAWLFVLAAVPLAMAIGSSVHRAGLAASAVETATRQQVPAVLLENVPLGTWSAVGLDERLPAKARWEWPRGTVHTGEIQAASGAAAGTVVPAWIDASGQAVAAPLTRDEADLRGVGAAIAFFGLALAVVRVAFAVFRRWLDRKRWAGWEADWARVGPQWTRHHR